MNLIRISENEAIIEPFFDGGESYPDNQKYACFSQYSVTLAPEVRAEVKQSWCDVHMLIYNAPADAPAVTMERTCGLDVSAFNSFLVCAGSDNTAIRLTVRTELGEEVAIDRSVLQTREISGNFRGRQLLGIRLEVFLQDVTRPGNLVLRWFGLASEQALQEAPLRFDPKWEGCFREDYEIAPEIGVFFNKEELPALRKKLKTPPFDKVYESIKADVYASKATEPEKVIEEYLINANHLMCREGHMHLSLLEGLQNMSFVALIEEDRELMHLAGRILLSVAVTPHWCESFMGNLPGATWHHRSFLEGLAVKRSVLALDWIGSCLTWHGKNLVYDAIQQKGMPRVDADMFSVEYVRRTNQGVVFNDERIIGYIALAKRYPRYEKMLQIAEADFFEMVDSCIEPDGGYLEGPSYWHYAMDNVVEAAHVLARYHGKSLAEFAPERLKRSGSYALSMLCRRPEGLRWLRVNDSYNYGTYGAVISDFYYRMSGETVWADILRENLHTGGLEGLLMVPECPQGSGEPRLPLGLRSLRESGETALHLQDGDKDILWHIGAGKPYFSHFHEDKGQIVLCVNSQELLIDRGNASAISKKPISHNLFVPESQDLPYSQPADAPGGRVLQDEYTDGVFRYAADLTQAWQPGIFRSITRSLLSEKPTEMVITDRAECLQSQKMSLRFQSVYPITREGDSFCIRGESVSLRITPVDYMPQDYAIREDGKTVCGEAVQQLVLYLPEAREYTVTTRLEILA